MNFTQAAGNATEVIECPQHIVGQLIGRGGEIVREMQSRSRCVFWGGGCVEVTTTSHHFSHCCSSYIPTLSVCTHAHRARIQINQNLPDGVPRQVSRQSRYALVCRFLLYISHLYM